MKELLLVCVNFNSYNELDAYLKSVCISLENSVATNLTVYVADNSTSYHEININSYPNLSIQQVSFNNIGYIGAAQSVINNMIEIQKYDYIIISNVDLLMSKSFIGQLEALRLPENVGWIAPSIKSLHIGRDKNPSVFRRYPKWKLLTLRITYNRWILPLYEKLYYNSKHKHVRFQEQDIYAGHGSFFVFTKSFMRAYPKLDYPIFLYGEELYFAELNRKAGLIVRYMPSLVINDFEHVSTSLIKRDTYYKYNQEAINYILERFY